MKTQPIETTKCKMLAVVLPEKPSSIEIIGNVLHSISQFKESAFHTRNTLHSVSLPSGDWQLLGRPSEVKAENWKKIIPNVSMIHIPHYPDYMDDEAPCYTEIEESAESLLTKHNIPENSFLIVEWKC